MATPTLSITGVNASSPPWGAAGDELKINLVNPSQSAPPVTISFNWPVPTVPLTEKVNAIYFSVNAKWAGFVITRTLSMTFTGPGGVSAGPFVLSPSGAQQFRQFQLSWPTPFLTVADLQAGVNFPLFGVTGSQVGGSESAADWSLFFSTMVVQAFTGADHGVSPPPAFGDKYIQIGATTVFNVLAGQSISSAARPSLGLFQETVGGTVPQSAQGVSWSIATVGGVQPATVGGFPSGTTSTDGSGNTACNTPWVTNAAFTGTYQMVAAPTSGTWSNNPARYTITAWPLPAGGAATPIFAVTSGAGHWCVAGVPDTTTVQFAASPGYNITVAFGSFVNISSVSIVNTLNAVVAGPLPQVNSTGGWSTDNNASYFRPNYSGVPNTGSYVATFTIRSPDNVTVCGTIAVTINVAKTAANLPIQNYNALQLFSEV